MTVTSVSSGREALALLERGTEFNLLLTDVMMPDVDGPALLHRVREDPVLHEMPVVMMSSNEHADETSTRPATPTSRCAACAALASTRTRTTRSACWSPAMSQARMGD